MRNFTKGSKAREIARISKAAIGATLFTAFGLLATYSARNAGSFFLGLLLTGTGVAVWIAVYAAIKKYRSTAEESDVDAGLEDESGDFEGDQDE